MKSFKLGIAAAALLAVSGCVIEGPGPFGPGPNVGRPGGVDGNWGDAGGVATSSLINGSFVSVANDTGNRVAEGSYRYTGANMIELDFFSLLRQQRVRANCILVTPNQLNCTNDGGQQFSLTRRSALG